MHADEDDITGILADSGIPMEPLDDVRLNVSLTVNDAASELPAAMYHQGVAAHLAR